MYKNFNLLKNIRDIVEGNVVSDEARSLYEAGKKSFDFAGVNHRGQIVLPSEYRGQIIATQANAGKEIVSEDKLPLLTALYAKSVLGMAGATFLTGLIRDISIPVYDGTTSAWTTEAGAATDGGGAFTEVTMSPRRLTTYVDVSKQFIIQDSISANQSLLTDIHNSIISKIELTAFDAVAADETRPAGLFYGVTPEDTTSGVTSWAKLITMKSSLDTANALLGNLGFITNPGQSVLLETTSVDPQSGIFCMQNGQIAGYPVFITNNIGTYSYDFPNSATTVTENYIAFGNWSDYLVGQWGGIDVTVDPYTLAVNGKVRLVINTFWDFKPKRAASFKLSSLR